MTLPASTPIRALMVGTPRAFRGSEQSAIAKTPVDRPIALGPLGFDGDAVADPIHHGGADKALHHYPHDHYSWWRERLGDHPLLEQPGAFGENLSTDGVVEETTYIGDRFRLGSALIEVSHGRQPCWKLDHRFERSGKQSVMAAIVASGRCGLYYRVIEPGMVAPDDTLTLVERGVQPWDVRLVFKLLIGGWHKSEPDAVRALAALEPLAAVWRMRAAKLAEL